MLVKNDPVKQKKVVKCLETLAVRMLRPLLSEKVFAAETSNTKLVLSLPAHQNVLREYILRPGVTLSTLYDLTLKDHVRWGKLESTGSQCVLLSLAKGLNHYTNTELGTSTSNPATF